MQILHIWDQAGVACIFAKYQKKMGHSVKVLRKANYDPYGIYEFYRDSINFIEDSIFLDMCVKESKEADIIHIHSRTDVLFHLREKLNKKCKIIMHFHGSELRGIMERNERLSLSSIPLFFKNYRISYLRKTKNEMAERLSDKVLISTPDLAKYITKRDYIFLHNPVDTEHFSYKHNKNEINSGETFFTFNTEAISDIEWIKDFCKRNGVNNLQIVDRRKNPIMYSDMPSFLRKFQVYVDVRYINYKVLENLSKTALESLSCGLKVLDYNLKYRQGLPREHDPYNVINRLETVYKQIM